MTMSVEIYFSLCGNVPTPPLTLLSRTQFFRKRQRCWKHLKIGHCPYFAVDPGIFFSPNFIPLQNIFGRKNWELKQLLRTFLKTLFSLLVFCQYDKSIKRGIFSTRTSVEKKSLKQGVISTILHTHASAIQNQGKYLRFNACSDVRGLLHELGK